MGGLEIEDNLLTFNIIFSLYNTEQKILDGVP